MKPFDINLIESELEFSFARSSGPGGQNVNKVNSKAIAKWNLYDTTALSPRAKQRFLSLYDVSDDGWVTVASDEYRDQPRNIQRCREKICDMIQNASHEPKKRIATKPSRAQKQKRIDAKKNRGNVKNLRRKVSPD